MAAIHSALIRIWSLSTVIASPIQYLSIDTNEGNAVTLI